MAFQGNPNAGAPDPALLNMLFQQKARREEQAWEREKYQIEAQRQAQLDAADQARKDREHRLSAASTLFDLQSKIQDRTKTLGESEAAAGEQMSAVEQQYPVSDYAQPAFAPIEQRPAGLFPLEAPDLQNVGVQSRVATQLMEPINAQRTSIENTLAGIPELASLRSSVPEQGRSAIAREARQAGIDLAVVTDKEKRDEARTIRTENRDLERTIEAEKRGIENAVTQAGLVAEEGQYARVRAGDALINLRSGLRAKIAKATKDGKDTSVMEERLGLLNGRIRALADPNSVRQVSTMPASQKIATIREYRGASAGLSRAIELGQALDDGKIKIGVVGAVENFKLRAIGMLENIARLDPNIDADVRGAIQSAIGEGKTTVTFTTDAGKQLTLGLDQIQLAYDMARNGRGGGARFTIREIESFMKEFAFTSPWTTEDQIRGALTKVAKQLGVEKATAAEIYRIFGEDVSELSGDEIFPDDLELIEGLSGGGPRGTVDFGSPGASGAAEQPSSFQPAVSESTIDSIRGRMKSNE